MPDPRQRKVKDKVGIRLSLEGAACIFKVENYFRRKKVHTSVCAIVQHFA